jgi:phosphatidylethanolamine/phosphatidyl-N-methylethanolamine N-methyltransferase
VISDHLLLLGRFLRSPRTIGAIAPSSQALACAMIRHIDFGAGPSVVELGIGTGAFTRQIAARIGPQGWYLGVEIEQAFVARARQQWPMLDCVCASADQLPDLLAARGVDAVDHIISGLPFASLPAAVTRAILAALRESIRPGGTFTTFQYLHGYRLSLAVTFRRQMSEVMGSTATRRLVVRNLPPAYVLSWTRSR